jgi:hypothetical protein
MTAEKLDKRVSLLQYINTGLLTLILGIATMAASSMTTYNKEVTTMRVKQTEIETTQKVNVANVANLNTRVTVLELNSINDLKNWVDLNYVRRAQSVK